MARFQAKDVENYKTSNGGSFFSLANDKDYARVRLMYNDMNDVELFSVHEVEANGQTYWVNCLREYDQPVDNCPLCKAGNRLQVKMWVPLYMEDTQEVKIWERGRTFISKLESANRRFNPLVSNIFEIERNGKKGDQNTTYELIQTHHDNVTLAELPQAPQIEGTIVKTLSFDELQDFVQTGKLAGATSATRNPATDRRPTSNNETPVTRRTASRTRGTGDQPKTDLF